MRETKIVIPTLGRIENQITFKSFSLKYRRKVSFVVQPHEFELMKKKYPNNPILVLPNRIKKIAPTRKWIFDTFGKDRFFVFDDDLKFFVKEYHFEDKIKWKSRQMAAKDFDDLFKLMHIWMNQGIHFGGLMPSSTMPALRYFPYKSSGRFGGNVFYDGPNIPKNLKWTRVAAGEDLDIALQLLTRGFDNRISTMYVAHSSNYAPGGCSTWRTLAIHNKSQKELARLWPEFVKTKEKILKSGPFKDKVKLSLTIQSKKAYKSSQQKEK